MGALHIAIISGSSQAVELIVFSTGLLLTTLLLVLTLRAAKLPGTSNANVGFAVCGFLWSAGMLAGAAVSASGIPGTTNLILLARAIQYVALALFPLPILAIWRAFAAEGKQQSALRAVRICAFATAAGIVVLLGLRVAAGAGFVTFGSIQVVEAWNAAILLGLGAAAALRPGSTPRAIFQPSLAIAAALFAAAVVMTLAWRAHTASHFQGIAGHLILLVVLCAFLLFARFRYADVFIRYGVRIVLAGTWAAILAFATQSSLINQIASHAPSVWAMHVFLIVIVANALLLSFTFVDERIGTVLSRWLFHSPDYQAERRNLAARLPHLEQESGVIAAAETAAREPLELAAARLIPLAQVPASSSALVEGDLVELLPSDSLRRNLPIPNVELLVPVATAGRVSHVLLIAPGGARPGLVTLDLNYLRAIAALCGHRLDGLRIERETIERQSREALLQQQVAEAELRALRAQINPHFLFNSLNTIADLIVRDPPRAEAMTLRLAGVFRHVLAHSSRALTAVRDEMEFLRTYLYIEEARFGDRLSVEMSVSPQVAGDLIPSLILQPLVENALKHGLGPKTGPGHLRISGRAEDGRLCLRVEDDGLGLQGRAPAGQAGLGLENIAARLKTLYQDRAGVVLEPRVGGGTRATVWIPRATAL